MKPKTFKPFRLETEGYPGDLWCDSLHSMCGSIKHGVGFYFTDKYGNPNGGWVISRSSLRRLFAALRREDGK